MYYFFILSLSKQLQHKEYEYTKVTWEDVIPERHVACIPALDTILTSLSEYVHQIQIGHAYCIVKPGGRSQEI